MRCCAAIRWRWRRWPGTTRTAASRAPAAGTAPAGESFPSWCRRTPPTRYWPPTARRVPPGRHRQGSRARGVRAARRDLSPQALNWSACAVRLRGRVGDDIGMRGPGRVGWAWVEAAALSVALGAVGFWIGGALGAGYRGGGWRADAAADRTGNPEAGGGRVGGRRQGAGTAVRSGASAGAGTGSGAVYRPGGGTCGFGELVPVRAGRAGAAGDRRGRFGEDSAGAGALRADVRAGLAVREVDEGAENEVVRRERAAAPGVRLLLVVDYAEVRAEWRSC